MVYDSPGIDSEVIQLDIVVDGEINGSFSNSIFDSVYENFNAVKKRISNGL